MALNYNYPYYSPYVSNQNTQSLVWVQGESGAKSYMVAPGNTVALWDSESQTVYLKSADASGMPSMRVLDYTIREDAHRTPILGSTSGFATKDDVVSIQRQIDEIRVNLKGGRNESVVSADEQ